MELIDKAALVAELEMMLKKEYPCDNSEQETGYDCALYELQDYLDTLEVKEVDLEKEIETHLKDCLDVKFPTTNIELIKKDVAYTAKKFFELGMSVSKQAMKDE